MKKLAIIAAVLLAACASSPIDETTDFSNGDPDPVDGCYQFPKYDYGCEHQTGGTQGGHVYAWECGSADGTPADTANEGDCYRIGYGDTFDYAWCCTEGE